MQWPIQVHYVFGGGGGGRKRSMPCHALPCRLLGGRGVNGLCHAVPKCMYQIKATHGSE